MIDLGATQLPCNISLWGKACDRDDKHPVATPVGIPTGDDNDTEGRRAHGFRIEFSGQFEQTGTPFVDKGSPQPNLHERIPTTPQLYHNVGLKTSRIVIAPHRPVVAPA